MRAPSVGKGPNGGVRRRVSGRSGGVVGAEAEEDGNAAAELVPLASAAGEDDGADATRLVTAVVAAGVATNRRARRRLFGTFLCLPFLPRFFALAMAEPCSGDRFRFAAETAAAAEDELGSAMAEDGGGA
jgi:hypothetical protein